MTWERGRRRFTALLSALALLSLSLSTPLLAHKHHKHPEQAARQTSAQQPTSTASQPTTTNAVASASHATMGEEMGDEHEDRSNMPFPARLLDWLGRTHPIIVHFPTAFFPAALFTAIVGRRRPAFGTPVRFLVIAGGILAPIVAAFGWLDSMNADETALLEVHEKLGTAIGAAGLLLAIWAWRRPGQDRSIGMIVALAIVTAAIVVQGWYGGAMVHGIEHLNW